MKKNTMMRIASVLLVAVLISTCAISGTFAKYVSDITATSETRVAKWAFTIGEDETNLAAEETFTFNLFDTVYDTANTQTLEEEDDIAENVIAPGTKGYATVEITNAGEVNATYELDFSDTDEANVPLQWSLDGTDWVDTLAELELDLDGDLDMGDSLDLTIYWMWAYGEDVDDTPLGIAGSAAPTFSVKVTVTQAD